MCVPCLPPAGEKLGKGTLPTGGGDILSVARYARLTSTAVVSETSCARPYALFHKEKTSNIVVSMMCNPHGALDKHRNMARKRTWHITRKEPCTSRLNLSVALGFRPNGTVNSCIPSSGTFFASSCLVRRASPKNWPFFRKSASHTCPRKVKRVRFLSVGRSECSICFRA